MKEDRETKTQGIYQKQLIGAAEQAVPETNTSLLSPLAVTIIAWAGN
jgi:hypothetical protein